MTRTEVMERRTRVLELSAFGMTDDEIAIELGYANRSGVWKARQRALAHHQGEAVENYRTLEVARLDALQFAIWDKAMDGDPQAVGTVLKIIDQRMRVLGLD